MCSTSVTIGPIYARLARRPLIHLILSASCPIDLSHTSVGVQSPTSTAGHGVLTMAMRKHRQTPNSQTSHLSDPAGDLVVEIPDDSSCSGATQRRVRALHPNLRALDPGSRYMSFGPPNSIDSPCRHSTSNALVLAWA